MNITNNPNYTCTTNPNNPYLDTISFKPPVSGLARQMQTTFLLDRICCVTNAVPYIVTSGNGKPSAIYTQAMNEVSKNPAKYNCTKQELERAYKTTFEILNAIGLSYKQNKKVNDNVFTYGVTILNDKFFEDVSNGKINMQHFIDGMKRMGNNLTRYKTCNNIINK